MAAIIETAFHVSPKMPVTIEGVGDHGLATFVASWALWKFQAEWDHPCHELNYLQACNLAFSAASMQQPITAKHSLFGPFVASVQQHPEKKVGN